MSIPNSARTALFAGLLTTAWAASPVAQQTGDQTARTSETQTAIVVMSFSAADLPLDGATAIDSVIDMAQEPHLSNVDVSAAASDDGSDGASPLYDLSGALVFSGFDVFSQWRKTEMEDYFAPVGGLDAVETSLRVFRPALVEIMNQGAQGGLKDVSIRYRNSGNDAAGDSDIDAVTVICPGDHADCKPSN